MSDPHHEIEFKFNFKDVAHRFIKLFERDAETREIELLVKDVFLKGRAQGLAEAESHHWYTEQDSDKAWIESHHFKDDEKK